jgi:diguanylate cyclase (GGDEF)-like protein
LIDGYTENYQIEKVFIHKKGHPVWVLQNTSLIRDADNKPQFIVLQIQDISERKKAEEKIHYAALHDALTGLPNRNLILDRLSLSVERAKRIKDYEFAVIFVDLDRFKIVNDRLGHDMGDELLVSLSIRLEKCIRSVDTIARLGGDEFAILLDGISDPKDAIDVAERILNCLQQPFDLSGYNFYSSASIGITYSSKGYNKPEDIISNADIAMYRAKANGKGRYEIFTDGMGAQDTNALKIENELRGALERNEIIPFYQPMVSLRTGKIVGFEALARWVNKKEKFVSPDTFIPVAEDTGLIVPLGISMLEQACEDICKWQKEFPSGQPLTISVNVSTKQFTQSNLTKQITNILIETGLHPSNLRLEVTESLLAIDVFSAIEILRELKLIGVQISIDDFGTGYSSLSYLHRFPFDLLKIDRSFVSNINADRESLAIVKTIIMLGKELGKSIVAEGIESQDHVEILSSLSCDYGQGFFFSRAVDSSAARNLLKEQWIKDNKCLEPAPYQGFAFEVARITAFSI